jgi:radical SAM protein with 4Fe4S-binding SPASM domain
MSSSREISYGDFGARLTKACSPSRVPLSGSIELTFRCNLRCVHCYIPDFSGTGEMSTDEIRRILDEIADEGCLWLLLTGGEILSRKDFPEIYTHAKRRGFLVTLFSNGTLLDRRIADLLAEYPPFGIEFTLYGMSDETYLRTSGFPGRFTRVRSAIDLLLERKLPLTLKAVAMEPLAEELESMKAFAVSLGVPFRYDAIIHGRLDGSMQPTRARSTPAAVVQHDARDPKRLEEWRRFYRDFVRTSRPSPYLMSCGAGVNSFHIDPKGRLLSCEALPVNGYDLRRGSFHEGWYGIVGEIRKRLASSANVCSSCELKSMCDRCPATATLETGSPDGWIPYYCEVTHRRAALLEESLGHASEAARYLAHADRVARGWKPEGVILPRGDSLVATSATCSAGACATGGCRTSHKTSGTTQLLQIELPVRLREHFEESPS